jgi:hypothetical protein
LIKIYVYGLWHFIHHEKSLDDPGIRTKYQNGITYKSREKPGKEKIKSTLHVQALFHESSKQI